MQGYDEWKLDNGEQDEACCEHCQEVFSVDNINEVTFIDADGDKRILWLCQYCEENQVWI